MLIELGVDACLKCIDLTKGNNAEADIEEQARLENFVDRVFKKIVLDNRNYYSSSSKLVTDDELKTYVIPFLERKITVSTHPVKIATLCARVDLQRLVTHIGAFKITDQSDLVKVIEEFAKEGVWEIIKSIKDFGITDQKLLVKLAKFCLKINFAETLCNIQCFGITDQQHLVEIAKVSVEHDKDMLLKYLKNFGITEQKVLVEIVKKCANTYQNLIYYILDLGITDKNDLLEIAKLRAKINVSEIAYFVQDFGFTKNMRIDLAKYCLEFGPYEVIPNIEKFEIQDSDVLFEIAILCAKKSPRVIAVNIEKFSLPKERQRIEVAIECAKNDAGSFVRNMNNFNIQDKDALITLAKICASQAYSPIPSHIKDFKIKDPNTLYEIAVLCAKHSSTLARRMKNFELEDQQMLTELARMCTETCRFDIASSIDQFKIKDLQTRISIAKLCVENKAGDLYENMEKFEIHDKEVIFKIAISYARISPYSAANQIQCLKIEDPQRRLAIAWECAKYNTRAISTHIKKFKIEDEQARIDLVKFCVQQNNDNFMRDFDNFAITNQKGLVDIAKISAKHNPIITAKHIQNFKIECEKDRVEIAKLCAAQEGSETVHLLHNFKIANEKQIIKIIELSLNYNGSKVPKYFNSEWISSEKDRFRIAIKCANKHGKKTAQYFYNFYLTDSKEVLSVFLECLCQNEITLYYRRNFRKSKAIIKMFEWKETDFISHLDTTDENKDILLKVHKKIQIEPVQLRGVRENWLLQSLYFLSVLEDKESRNWMIESGFWSILGDLRVPVLRPKLTGKLYKLVQDKHYRDLCDPLLKETKNRWPQLSLMLIALYPFKEFGLNDGEILNLIHQLKFYQREKRSSLRDIYTIHRLLKTTNLLGSALHLTGEQKIRGLKRIFFRKNTVCTEAAILENIRSAQALLQLQDTNWISSSKPLVTLFHSCFNDVIPLQDNIGDIFGKIEKIFGTDGLSWLITYATGLKTQKDPALLECFAKYVQSVLDGSFKEIRYQTENNPHLDTVFKARPDILEKWRENTSIPLDLISLMGGDSITLDPKEWLKTKLFIDKHLGDLDLPILREYLDKGVEKKIEESSEDKSLEFQKLCLQLLKIDNDDRARLIKCLKEMKKLVKNLYPKTAFISDLTGVISALKNSDSFNLQKGSYTVTITDDPRDLLFCGTDISGSCQHLDGLPDYNKGLLGYMMDGKNMLLAIKKGKTIVRCLLRLMWDEVKEQPVLFMDRFYPDTVSPAQTQALTHLAKIRAKELNVPLTSCYGKARYGQVLKALGGPAPYEYADSQYTNDYGADGLVRNGKFKIKKAYLVV